MADLSASQLITLANELNNDPKGLGYAGGKNNSQDANLLNTPGASNEKISAGLIPSWQVMDQIVQSEFILLTSPNQNLFLAYISAGYVDAASSTTQANFVAMFPTATAPTTHANLVALVNRPATRGEILFGAGTIINSWDVGRALNRAT